MLYKKSEFNYVQNNGDKYIVYNTLYNSMVRLNGEEYLDYTNIDVSNKDRERVFVETGLWIDADIDEKSRYLAYGEAYTLHMPRPLSITITTTLKCNARCSYCYEKGIKQTDIIPGMEKKILEFIRRNNDTNEVRLVWFGGEPLLNMDFMDSMSQLLLEEGITYSSYIITNGSLLNEYVIKEKFPLWNVKSLQITLDGNKDAYKKIKNYKNPYEGEFFSILKAITITAKAGVFVNIRLNIGRENREDIIELLQEIDHIFARFENVVFYPAFLTGEVQPLSDDEKVEFIKNMLLSVRNIKKLTAGTKFYSLPRMHTCMKGDPKSFVIDVNGNVYSCDHYVGKVEHRMGFIDDSYKKTDIRGKNVLFRTECQKCVFLPKCYGGCEANYIEGDSPCMIEKYLIQAYLQIL